MKKLLLLISFFAASVLPSMAEGADWYLYLYSYTNGAYLDMPQFQTTEDDDVFKISNYELTETGVKFCVTNADWSSTYGWAEGAAATVSTTGTAAQLGASSGATGWIGLAAGTYDITFDAANLTIQFDAWSLYFYSETYSLDGDAGQFTPTSTIGVYQLTGCTVPGTGISFCVHTTGWGTMLGWGSGGTVEATGTPVTLASASGATGWMTLDAGTYNVTFNSNDLTIQFDYLNSETRTSAADKWGTVCLPFEVSSIENAVAYEVEGLNGTTGLVLKSVELPLTAGKPYFYKASDANVVFNCASSNTASAAVAAAGLVGNITGASMNVANNGTSYVLSNNELHPVNSANVKISDRRAYVDIDGLSDVSTTTAPGRVVMQIPAVATDIESVGLVQAEKLFINGQVVIVRDGVRYNVMGQIIR